MLYDYQWILVRYLYSGSRYLDGTQVPSILARTVPYDCQRIVVRYLYIGRRYLVEAPASSEQAQWQDSFLFRLTLSCLFPFNSLVLLRCQTMSNLSSSLESFLIAHPVTADLEWWRQSPADLSVFTILHSSLSFLFLCLSLLACLLCPSGDLQ